MTENRVNQSLPTILDIEASKFDKQGFPVEIGFIRSDGFCFCSLIKPQANWTTWDSETEKIHGISRHVLNQRGNNVKDVARTLNQHLAGYVVYSDNSQLDASWLETIFDEAELRMEFTLEQLPVLLTEAQKAVWQATRQRVEKMLGLRRHRASADARIIQMTYHLSVNTQVGNAQDVA